MEKYYLKNDNNDNMGYISYEIKNKILIISMVFVDENFRGLGVGSTLMKNITDFAIKQNFKIKPICPFAAKFYNDKEEYRRLIVD